MTAENYRRDRQQPAQLKEIVDIISKEEINAAETAVKQTKESIAKWLKEEDEPTLIKLLKHFVNS